MAFIETEYKDWLTDLKSKVRSAQIKASLAVNSALIHFYWELGKMISEKENIWGGKLISSVSEDLREEFPDMKGFSVSNLKYCKNFYNFYNSPIGQQAVDQLQDSDNQEDSLIKDESDNPSIGILLGKDKNNVEAEFALRDMNKPMGVSELRLVESLPKDLQASMPTIAELEEEFSKLDK